MTKRKSSFLKEIRRFTLWCWKVRSVGVLSAEIIVLWCVDECKHGNCRKTPQGYKVLLVGNHCFKVGYTVTFEAPLTVCLAGPLSNSKRRCQIVSHLWAFLDLPLQTCLLLLTVPAGSKTHAAPDICSTHSVCLTFNKLSHICKDSIKFLAHSHKLRWPDPQKKKKKKKKLLPLLKPPHELPHLTARHTKGISHQACGKIPMSSAVA